MTIEELLEKIKKEAVDIENHAHVYGKSITKTREILAISIQLRADQALALSRAEPTPADEPKCGTCKSWHGKNDGWGLSANQAACSDYIFNPDCADEPAMEFVCKGHIEGEPGHENKFFCPYPGPCYLENTATLRTRISELEKLLKEYRTCELCTYFNVEYRNKVWWEHCNHCSESQNNWVLKGE